MKKKHLLGIFFGMLLLTACQNEEVYTPKPRGYCRMDIQDTGFVRLDNKFPYSFEYSQYAYIDPYPYRNTDSTKYWINIVYPNLNAVMYISYKQFNNKDLLNNMISDARTLVFKQTPKADDIIESTITDEESHVFGKLYQAVGQEVPCPYQLWLSDREQHFFRLSLYFNCTPNNDSLAPAIDYLSKDIFHLIETFDWK